MLLSQHMSSMHHDQWSCSYMMKPFNYMFFRDDSSNFVLYAFNRMSYYM